MSRVQIFRDSPGVIPAVVLQKPLASRRFRTSVRTISARRLEELSTPHGFPVAIRNISERSLVYFLEHRRILDGRRDISALGPENLSTRRGFQTSPRGFPNAPTRFRYVAAGAP